MGRVSTHVLDTHSGCPAAGMRIQLTRFEGDRYRVVRSLLTNADGRTDVSMLAADAMAAGRYELLFHVAEYFRARGVAIGEPPFLDIVPVRFAIADPTATYHVPLLCTPWSYTTYRGS